MAMLNITSLTSQNGTKGNNGIVLQNSLSPPGGISVNDQLSNTGANILRRNGEGNGRKSNLVSEKQFLAGMIRIYLAIDDEARAQFLFDIFDVSFSGFITKANTKILLYHSLDWKNIQLQNHVSAAHEGNGEVAAGSHTAFQNNSPLDSPKINANNQKLNIPPIIFCDEILSSSQQSPDRIAASCEDNQNNQFRFSIPNVQPAQNKSALLFSEMLGGSNFSLLSDKRILVAKIIEMTFGEKEQLNYADFRAQGRLLSDLIFTQLVLNLPCSLYFNTAKKDLETQQKETYQQQAKMMMQNQMPGQIMDFNSQLPLEVLQSIPQIQNNQSLFIAQKSAKIQQHCDHNLASEHGQRGSVLGSAQNQDGSFEVPQNSFSKQQSINHGVNQGNNNATNLLLPLNKAGFRADHGESFGSNMAQFIRSVLANQNQQQKQLLQVNLEPQQHTPGQQQVQQISHNNNARCSNPIQVTPSNLLINSSGEVNSGFNVAGGINNINTQEHRGNQTLGKSHELLCKTLNTNNQSPINENKEIISPMPSNVVSPHPIASGIQQNVSSQAMIMMRPRSDPQGGGKQSKIFIIKSGEEFKQYQVNRSDESCPNRGTDQEKHQLAGENSHDHRDFVIKICGVKDNEENKHLRSEMIEEVLESDCSVEQELQIGNEFQHPERQSVMLQINMPYFSQTNSNYEHMKLTKEIKDQEDLSCSPKIQMEGKLSDLNDSILQSPCLKNKVPIVNRNNNFSGILIDGNMGSVMSGFTPHDFGSGIVQNSFGDQLQPQGSLRNARGQSQNPSQLRRQAVSPLQKMFNDKVNPSQLKGQKSSFYNQQNNQNRRSFISQIKESPADPNQQTVGQPPLIVNAHNIQLRQPLTMKQQHVIIHEDVLLEKILTHIAVQKNLMDGPVYLKNTTDQSILKNFLEVKGNDLYCYTSEAKRKLRFMHSLLGCFIVEMPAKNLPLMPKLQATPVETFYPVELRLSHICKRQFYFMDDSVRQMWIKQFKDACGQVQFGDFYRMGDYIAEGSFGKVFKAYHRDTGRLVAVKQISKSKMEECELEVQTNEIELLKVIDHPNVVQLIEYYEDPFSIYLVLEHLQGYNLMKFITDKKTLNEDLLKRIMRDIFTGISYLHEIGIVHRDIKLDNIMMNIPTADTSLEYALPKLIDFGLATVLMPRETRTEGFGTIAYCSPEIILRKPYSYSTDIWSIGVVFYVLLSGFFPFMAYEKKHVVKNILHAKLTLNSPSIFLSVSNEPKDLLLKMLLRDQTKRISAQQVLQDVWFQKC